MKNALKIETLRVTQNGAREPFELRVAVPYVNKHGDWETILRCPSIENVGTERLVLGESREHVLALAIFVVIDCLGGVPILEDENGQRIRFPRPEDLDPDWDRPYPISE